MGGFSDHLEESILKDLQSLLNSKSVSEAKAIICTVNKRLILCFTSHSTARVILRQVVYGWRKPVHTSWSRLCTVNHRASTSNYQLSNMKHPGRDSNRQPQRLKVSTLTATPPNPLAITCTPNVNLKCNTVFPHEVASY